MAQSKNGKRDILGCIYDEADEEGKETMRSLAGRLLSAQKSLKRTERKLPSLAEAKADFANKEVLL